MIKYFQYSKVYLELNEDIKQLTKVINTPEQKNITVFPDSRLYSNMCLKSGSWEESDQATFESNKASVISYFSSM